MAAHTPDKVLVRHLQRIYDAAEAGGPPANPELRSGDQLAQRASIGACTFAVSTHSLVSITAQGVWHILHNCKLVLCGCRGMWVTSCDMAECLLMQI